MRPSAASFTSSSPPAMRQGAGRRCVAAPDRDRRNAWRGAMIASGLGCEWDRSARSPAAGRHRRALAPDPSGYAKPACCAAESAGPAVAAKGQASARGGLPELGPASHRASAAGPQARAPGKPHRFSYRPVAGIIGPGRGGRDHAALRITRGCRDAGRSCGCRIRPGRRPPSPAPGPNSGNGCADVLVAIAHHAAGRGFHPGPHQEEDRRKAIGAQQADRRGV